MLKELSIIVILLLLVLSFRFHYITNQNVKTLFREEIAAIKKQIQELKNSLQKHD